MKKLLLVLLCMLTVAVPVAAQDSACTIDLASVVASLVQAQASASSGDTTLALTQIAQARTKLEAIEALCGAGADVIEVTPTPVALPLTQTFTLEDELVDATFRYPEGWAVTEDSGGVVIGTSSDVVTRDFGSEPPPFFTGEAAIFIGVGDAATYGVVGASTPVELLETMRDAIPPSFGSSTTPVTLTINDRRAALFTVNGADTDLMILSVVLDASTADTVFALYIMLTAPGELNVFEPTLQAIAGSLRVTQ